MVREIAWLKCEKYGGNEVRLRTHLKSDFKRLAKGEPIDYIIGWRDFLGCRIDLTNKPLIPRVETEFWVEKAIKELKEVAVRSRFSSEPEMRLRTTLRVLDLFAGSGCIGQAIKKRYPKIKLISGDLYPVNSQIIKTDIFSNISDKFDVIFANPPYVPTLKSKVQKSVKNWEPKKALFAGPDGLTIIKKFLKQAQNYLKPDGLIYLEFGYGQKLAIIKLLKKYNYKSWQFNKDQFGKWRWVVIK